MSSDFSRVTFDPWNDFGGVLMQQGRVQLDADWNEQIAIVDRRWRAETIDIIGRCVVSNATPDAFKIVPSDDGFLILPGRMYADGLLAENHGIEPTEFDSGLEEIRGTKPVPYDQQPFLPNAPALRGVGTYLVYLDVWHRECTYLQHDLIEKAVGIDTTSRLQTVWQVKAMEIGAAAYDCESSDIAEWDAETESSAGRMSTGTATTTNELDPCRIPPAANYRGLENRLYRVEIHTGGALDAARFKWSRVNATVATEVDEILSSSQLTVRKLGNDDYLRIRIEDWVEVLDDLLELRNRAGFMSKVVDIDEERRLLTIDPPLPSFSADPPIPFDTGDPNRHTRVIRWDQKKNLDADGLLDVTNGQIDLEDGIQVSFGIDPNQPRGKFQVGDYWLFYARTADSSIEILHNEPPRGVHHHYCRLAILGPDDSGELTIVHDCRKFFPQRKIPDKPGVRIEKVLVTSPRGEYEILGNDTTIGANTLSRGVQIQCDSQLAEESVKGKPVCMVTLDIPYPLTAIEEVFPEPNGLVGFQPIILASEAYVDDTFIVWKPTVMTEKWLDSESGIRLLFNHMLEREWGVRILAHLSVKSNFVWDRDDPDRFLDGNSFGINTNGVTRLRLPSGRLPSGDRRRGGDFEMWFWLVSE